MFPVIDFEEIFREKERLEKEKSTEEDGILVSITRSPLPGLH